MGSCVDSDIAPSVPSPRSAGRSTTSCSRCAADVTKGLFALKDETLGGLIAPTTYQQGSKGAPAFNTCYFNIQIKGGQYQSLNGGKPVCIDPAKLAPLMPKS